MIFPDEFCSVWVFVLLGVEGIKTFKANPHFTYAAESTTTYNAYAVLIV